MFLTHIPQFLNARLTVVLNHSARSHIPKGIHLYLYASAVASCTGISAKLSGFPSALLPKRKYVTHGNMIFNDRFRVQIWEKPVTTITCHTSKDGHNYIHPDPSKCRSLTVREAERIQTFPDNYFFEGPRTEQ
jgi:DNA (cytosine-5)-methyltransferase 1